MVSQLASFASKLGKSKRAKAMFAEKNKPASLMHEIMQSMGDKVDDASSALDRGRRIGMVSAKKFGKKYPNLSKILSSSGAGAAGGAAGVAGLAALLSGDDEEDEE